MKVGQERHGRGRRTRFWVLLGAVVLSVAWLGLARRVGEPSYEGVRLSQWLAMAYSHDGQRFWENAGPEFEAAMQGMGTNAIPHLVRMVGYERSRLAELAYVNLELGRAVSRWREVRRQRGRLGLKAMGPVVTNAFPVLLDLWERDRAGVEAAMDILGSSYFSNVVQVMREGPVEMQLAGMHVLAEDAYDFKREEVVAIWMECLKDPDARVRLSAARLIGETRPVRARMAIGALEAAMGDEDAEVARAAKEAERKLRGKN